MLAMTPSTKDSIFKLVAIETIKGSEKSNLKKINYKCSIYEHTHKHGLTVRILLDVYSFCCSARGGAESLNGGRTAKSLNKGREPKFQWVSIMYLVMVLHSTND